MAQYYYSKYNVVTKRRYNDTTPFRYVAITQTKSFIGKAKGYSFNADTNRYTVSNEVWKKDEMVRWGDHCYEIEYTYILRYTPDSDGQEGFAQSENRVLTARKFEDENSYSDITSQGSLVQSNIVAIEGTYPINGKHSDGFWYVRGALTNAVPTLSLATTDNRILYENDSFGISGSATDTDSGNVVSVKYQLNGGTERAITSGISTGASIPFNRSLTYKGGMLYDGSTAVTPALAESTTHSLKVWAEDDKGGKSAIQTRLFTVVANRPAALVIEPFVTAGNLIDSDTMTIKGNVADPENNTVVVRYKIGSGSYVEVLNGVGGPFTIPIKLSALKSGANTVTIQATDSYGAVSSKTLNVAKSGSVQPLKTSVVRYKINPPNGSAKGVLLWIEREVGDLTVDAEISATMAGEAESFVPMTKTSTAFVTDGIEEDEFTHDAVTPKDNIVIKLTMTRASTASNNGIKLISGVLS